MIFETMASRRSACLRASERLNTWSLRPERRTSAPNHLIRIGILLCIVQNELDDMMIFMACFVFFKHF